MEVRCGRRRRESRCVLNAKKQDATSQAQQPDGLAANGGGRDRIRCGAPRSTGKSRPIWGIFGFLAFVAAWLLVWLLSGVFAGSAAASEGEEPAQPTSFVTWHTDNFFTQCDGNCAVSVFGGPQLLTHQYNILVHLTPPWDWRFGKADLIGGAISRRILTLWDSLDIEVRIRPCQTFR